MSVRGYSMLIWDVEALTWASYACSTERDRLEPLAERLRELAGWPARVVEASLLDDGMIVVLNPDISEPGASDIFPEYESSFGHDEGSPES